MSVYKNRYAGLLLAIYKGVRNRKQVLLRTLALRDRQLDFYILAQSLASNTYGFGADYRERKLLIYFSQDEAV